MKERRAFSEVSLGDDWPRRFAANDACIASSDCHLWQRLPPQRRDSWLFPNSKSVSWSISVLCVPHFPLPPENTRFFGFCRVRAWSKSTGSSRSLRYSSASPEKVNFRVARSASPQAKGGVASRWRYSTAAKVAILNSLTELRAGFCGPRSRGRPDRLELVGAAIGHLFSAVRIGSGPMPEELEQKHTSRDDHKA